MIDVADAHFVSIDIRAAGVSFIVRRQLDGPRSPEPLGGGNEGTR